MSFLQPPRPGTRRKLCSTLSMSAQDGFEGDADVKTHTVTQDAREDDGDVLPPPRG
jgi:hypothetical protein